jgi:prepilin-type N-terminal cleavage/methylation domain-containing protein
MIRKQRQTTCRKYRGFVLTEVLVVIAAGSVIFATAIATLVWITQTQKRLHAADQYAAARIALDQQFRRDVRAANKWSRRHDDKRIVIELVTINERIEYTSANESLIRTRFVQAQPVSKEVFAMRAGTQFSVSGEDDEQLLSFTIEYPVSGRDSHAKKQFSIRAALGLDLRFVRGD